MPPRWCRYHRPGACVAAATAAIVSILLLPPGPGNSGSPGAASVTATDLGAVTGPLALATLLEAPLAPVSDVPSDGPPPGSTWTGAATSGVLPVLVTLAHANESRLQKLLTSLDDRAGPEYHRFLSAAAFDHDFSPAASSYDAALGYFTSFGVQNVTTLPDRTAISFAATPGQAAEIFHVSFGSYTLDGRSYLAPTGPVRLPAPLASMVDQVEGLGTFSASHAAGLTGASVQPAGGARLPASSVPAATPVPPTVGGTQYVYGSDLQSAYDELSLFAQYGYPTNATVATIFSDGSYTGPTVSKPCGGTLHTGEDVGPFAYPDVYSYFNATMAGEPHPTVVGVPLDGATAPSFACLASWDNTSAVVANTADLELLGSTAPGARIYGLFTPPSPTESELDAAFLETLSPSSSLGASVVAGLKNVTVISNPWGFADTNDSAWYGGLEQAQARGITVLAATGDSADNPASPAWAGSESEFPASMAYDDFGTVAVGGASITLSASSTPRLRSDVAWNNTSKVANPASHQQGPSGSAGGISAVVVEPRWQARSSASSVITTNGRAVPDLAAIANNTLVTVTLAGVRYLATNASVSGTRFASAWGTGLSVSAVAGLVATIDHTLRAAGEPVVGFLDPTLYPLASLEHAALPSGSVNGSYVTGSYASPLPTLPVEDITAGRNDAFVTRTGYDLVTGWGSLDAYNFTMYVLNVSSAGIFGRLSAVQDVFVLNGLSATTSALGAPSAYNASVQQDLFLANSFGAPVYWVQSVVDIAASGSSWAMNFTAWVSAPFFGIYPGLPVVRYSFPATGEIERLPVTFDLVTSLVPSPSWSATSVEFSFGVAGVSPLTLSVPGAAFIVGTTPYTYNWQGTNFTNGPLGPTNPPGFLAPQFGLVGALVGLAGGTGTFSAGTAGTVAASVEPIGTGQFESADSVRLKSSAAQSIETAAHLGYTASGHGDWSVAYSAGGTDQGIIEFEPPNYALTFQQTGAPASSTWYVNLSSGARLSAPGTVGAVALELPNGTYPWTDSIAVLDWAGTPSSGSAVVNGGPATYAITFHTLIDSVEFIANGPTFPFRWYVNITNGPSLTGDQSTLETNLTFGTYTYHVASSNNEWAPDRYTGTFAIGPRPTTVNLRIGLVTYAVALIASQPVGIFPHWTVTVDGITKQGYDTLSYVWELPNGTYSFSITGLPSGYTATPSSGQITVHGPFHPRAIIITPPSGLGGLFGLGIYGYVLVAGLAGGAAIGIVLLVRRRRRRRAQTPPAGRKAPAGPPPRGPPPRSRGPRRPPPRRPRAGIPTHESPRSPPPPGKSRRWIGPDEL
jgi:Pro-kumamolisin, activation domain